MRTALELARAGDDRNRPVIAEFDRSDGDERRSRELGVQSFSFLTHRLTELDHAGRR
jgi:hypothetical protein